MKEKLLKKYIVLENYEDGKFYVTLRSNFEETKIWDCYGRHGQQLDVDCCDTNIDVLAWTYWDGHNYQSIILDDMFNASIEEADEDISIEILQNMPQTSTSEATEEIKVGKYNYFYSNYESFPYVCTVELN